MKPYTDAAARRIMRERFTRGKRTMSRDDWEMVICQILFVFNALIWGKTLIQLFGVQT